MGIAFLVGAVVPLLPYMLITVPRYDLGGALAATALTLFAVGYFEGWLAHRSRSLAVGHALSRNRDDRGGRRLRDRTRDLATRCDRRLALFA